MDPDDLYIQFQKQLKEYAKLPASEKQRTLQAIGIVGANGKLTTRFGGRAAVVTSVSKKRVAAGK